MKILTEEEQNAHYRATVQGGLLGGAVGVGFGAAAIAAASRRYPTFRGLTLPFRAFLVASTGTFGAIIQADRSSNAFEKSRHPEKQYYDEQEELRRQLESQKSTVQRAKDWANENRYGIVFASWVASMGIALGIVRRNPYLTSSQKLVQARVYAQGLTVAVLLASFALEANDAGKGKGRWETVKVIDPNDPEHKKLIEKRIHHERYAGEDQWRDMIEAEEQRIKEREEAKRAREAKIREEKLHPKA